MPVQYVGAKLIQAVQLVWFSNNCILQRFWTCIVVSLGKNQIVFFFPTEWLPWLHCLFGIRGYLHKTCSLREVISISLLLNWKKEGNNKETCLIRLAFTTKVNQWRFLANNELGCKTKFILWLHFCPKGSVTLAIFMYYWMDSEIYSCTIDYI